MLSTMALYRWLFAGPMIELPVTDTSVIGPAPSSLMTSRVLSGMPGLL